MAKNKGERPRRGMSVKEARAMLDGLDPYTMTAQEAEHLRDIVVYFAQDSRTEAVAFFDGGCDLLRRFEHHRDRARENRHLELARRADHGEPQ